MGNSHQEPSKSGKVSTGVNLQGTRGEVEEEVKDEEEQEEEEEEEEKGEEEKVKDEEEVI